MAIKLLVAVDEAWQIGYKGKLLFNIPADLKRFKDITTGEGGSPNIVLMGRKTYESLPVDKLPHRLNVVLTSNKDLKVHPEVFKIDSVQHVLNHYYSGSQDRDLFVIGGSKVYSDFLEHADEVLVTYIEATADKADTYFNREKLEELFYIGGIEHNYCEENDLKFHYVTYKRKKF